MKYLYIDGGGSIDYAATTFEQDFKGSRKELWEKANKAGKSLEYEDRENDIYFFFEALDLDDSTVEQLQYRMDYDDSKNSNYFKVED